MQVCSWFHNFTLKSGLRWEKRGKSMSAWSHWPFSGNTSQSTEQIAVLLCGIKLLPTHVKSRSVHLADDHRPFSQCLTIPLSLRHLSWLLSLENQEAKSPAQLWHLYSQHRSYWTAPTLPPCCHMVVVEGGLQLGAEKTLAQVDLSRSSGVLL